MRWSRRPYSAVCFSFLALFGIFSFIFLSFLHPASAEEKKISIYSNAANYTLSVTERNGQDYVGLQEILEPLGTVSVKTDGLRWKLRYKTVAAEFTAGESRARVQGLNFDLPASFLLENGRGLVRWVV